MRPFSCKHCDKEIDPDPVFQVDCPTCEAEAGEKCKRPSGHPVWDPQWGGLPKGAHPKRDLKALDEGAYGSCPLGRCPESLAELDRKPEGDWKQAVGGLLKRNPRLLNWHCSRQNEEWGKEPEHHNRPVTTNVNPPCLRSSAPKQRT